MNRREFIKNMNILAISMGSFALAPLAYALPRTVEDLVAISEAVTDTGVGYGELPSVSTPDYYSVSDAGLSIDDDEVVFIFAFPESPDEIYIVSQEVMVWHEVLNELHQGKAYCLTYSPVSGTLAFFEARVQNTNLIFDTSGELYNNNSVLIDRNTGSRWSQLLGMAFEGPLMGTGLSFMPVYWTRWRFAKNVYSDAKVMITPQSTSSRIYGRDPYGSFQRDDSYYQDEHIYFPLTHYDTRFPAKSLMYVIEKSRALIAIDIEYVREKQVVNFYLGPYALVAIFDNALDTVKIFDRRYWQDQDPGLFYYRNGLVYDYATRSIWNTQGQCIEGFLQNATMPQLHGYYSFWFAYAAINPETFTVPGETVVPDSALQDF